MVAADCPTGLVDGELTCPAWGAAGAAAGDRGGVETADEAPAAGGAADDEAVTDDDGAAADDDGTGVEAGVEAGVAVGGALPPGASSGLGAPLADFAAVLRCAEAEDATGCAAPPDAGARAGCRAEPIARAPAIKSPGMPTTHRAKRSGRFAAESMILANMPGIGTGPAVDWVEAVRS